MSATSNAVTNALDLLDLLGRSEQGLRLKDIARELELPESSTHRLLASLTSRGYVEQREEHGPYLLGWKIVILANTLGRDARLVQMARPYLERLAREAGQGANLAVFSNDVVLYLDCQTPRQSLALYSEPGVTLPVHATSLGKVLLAFASPSEQTRVLDRISYEVLTPNTPASREELVGMLPRIRELGYALDEGEVRQDVSCIAAPLLEPEGRLVAAISVTASTVNLPSNWKESLPPIITTIAREASEQLFGAAHPLVGRGV